MNFLLPIATTTIIGILAFFIKGTLSRMESNYEKLFQKMEDMEQRHNADIERLSSELNQLKNDLPMVYVLREDFLRVMNNVDQKLDKIQSYILGGR